MSAKSIKTNFQYWPSLKCFKSMIDIIIEELPQKIKFIAKEITFLLENYPEEQILFNFNLTDRYDLLAFFKCIDTGKNDSNINKINCIFLYRGPIIRYALLEKKDIQSVIKNVVLFEMQHLFKKKSLIIN